MSRPRRLLKPPRLRPADIKRARNARPTSTTCWSPRTWRRWLVLVGPAIDATSAPLVLAVLGAGLTATVLLLPLIPGIRAY